MTQHLRSNIAPQYLQITKNSLTPLPPHFADHWTKILHEASLTLTHLLLKYHEEEGDILDAQITTTTRLLRYISTPEQLKQYTTTLTQTSSTPNRPTLEETYDDAMTKHAHNKEINRKRKQDQLNNATTTKVQKQQEANWTALTKRTGPQPEKHPTSPKKRRALLPTPNTKHHRSQTPFDTKHTHVKTALLPTPNEHNRRTMPTPTAHTRRFPTHKAPIPLMSITFTKQTIHTNNQQAKNFSQRRHKRPPNNRTPNTPTQKNRNEPHRQPTTHRHTLNHQKQDC